MKTTLKIDLLTLRDIMGESFNMELFNEGRKDAKKFCKSHTLEEVRDKYAKVVERMEGGNFRHTKDPSYWMGCLSEMEWMI